MSMLVRNAGSTVRSFLLSAALVGVVTVGGLAYTGRAHADPQQVSQAVADKYIPAGDAYKKHDFATALKLGKEALAVAKTPFEKQSCLLLIYGSAANNRDYPSAIEAGEQLVALDGYPAKQKLDIEKSLGQMYAATNKFDKAISTTKSYMQGSGGGTASDWALLATLYSAQHNCSEGLAALDKALAGGKQADESQLKQQSFCYHESKNTDKRIAVNEELLKRFPKKEYFTQLSVIYQTERKLEDPALLALLRYGFDRDYLSDENEFIRLANLDLDVGAASEAERVLEKGMAKKAVTSADKNKRLLEQAKNVAAEDKKAITQLDAEARAGKNGESDVKVGVKYFSFGQYDKAAEAIARGLQGDRAAKVKNPDDANMVLGIALLKLKKGADAAKAFNAAKASARMAPPARLWGNAT